MKKAGRKSYGYGLVLGSLLGMELMAGGGMALGHSPAQEESAQKLGINMYVYNYAQVADMTLEQSEKAAAAIFNQIGVEVSWANCHPVMRGSRRAVSCPPRLGPAYFYLRIVPSMPTVRGASDVGSMGMAVGDLATVSSSRITNEAAAVSVDVAKLLGMVMAHEMGHMMGLHSHSLTGIMRAGWTSEDYALANQQALLFTAREGELVRRQVRALAQEHATAELATTKAPQ